jgi:hypothetical protein
MERAALSPKEFASIFGKSQTWGYRQIYAGKVNAVTEVGRILIPVSEIEKILGTATRYSAKKKVSAEAESREQPALRDLMQRAHQLIAQKKQGSGARQLPNGAAKRLAALRKDH